MGTLHSLLERKDARIADLERLVTLQEQLISTQQQLIAALDARIHDLEYKLLQAP